MPSALVIGASGDLGQAIAIQLAHDGFSLWLHCNRNLEKTQSLASTIQKQGIQAHVIQCDLSQTDHIQEAFTPVFKDPELQVFVNSAGSKKDGIFMRFKEDDFNQIFTHNVTGVTMVTQAVVTYYVRKKIPGKIIMISSVIGEHGNAGQTNYAMAKAAINGLTKSLAKEYGKRGITVNAIAPGLITSEMTKNLDNESYLQHIPLERYGTPQEVAHLASFLANPATTYITGQIFNIDGGLFL